MLRTTNRALREYIILWNSAIRFLDTYSVTACGLTAYTGLIVCWTERVIALTREKGRRRLKTENWLNATTRVNPLDQAWPLNLRPFSATIDSTCASLLLVTKVDQF